MVALASSFVAFLVLVTIIKLRVKRSGSSVPLSGMNVFELSARYRPMLRLLDGSDFELLGEAGDPKLMKKTRAQRRQIFRSYLRGLRRDHAVLCATVRNAMVNAEVDRKDLASALFRLEAIFRVLLITVQLRLMLHALGVGTITAAPLVSSVERVSTQAKLLVPQQPAQTA